MDHLDRVRATRRKHDQTVAAATAEFHAVITDALRAHVRIGDVADAAGYHRNHIGRIRAAFGIPDGRRKRAADHRDHAPAETTPDTDGG